MPARYPPRLNVYEPVETVPEGLRWKAQPGHNVRKDAVVLFSMGNVYKLVRTLATGEVAYFKAKDGPPKSPSDKIDAEPTPAKQIRYRTGTKCWFVISGRWFLVSVFERDGKRIVLKSETGMDADRTTPWPHPDMLEISASQSNYLYQCLRPLKARYV